jgi:putative transposase
MVDRKDPVPVTRQCALLELPRSTFYHIPKPVTDKELELMALIDRCHLKYPFYGTRRIRDWFEDQGHAVNRKRIQRLMRTMGISVGSRWRNAEKCSWRYQCPIVMSISLPKLSQFSLEASLRTPPR